MAQDEAVALLEALCEHASQDRFVTNHRHRQFDLIHRISLRSTPPAF